MHLVVLFLLLSTPADLPASPAPQTTHGTTKSVGEVTELIVPKACVQRVECKGEWHLKNKMWSCPSLTVAFNCYRPKVEPASPHPGTD